ncbi:hypothetical protein Ah1_00095 [Aeromonas phage Ah1]|uniref:Uncharacterized protein n=1 Tax=Aeromonas phage Ah1 TaxID=2053701 RepID=A0A2H4YFB6_9CAUD|nr:hypothetical protein KNT77_gp095 [Aeromonas phage Ah1]AUE22636.1 hypothetical protein Ah1_00095 [Aeromonas phage Ah1]
MTVKTSYRGMVRVNNVKSKHHALLQDGRLYLA